MKQEDERFLKKHYSEKMVYMIISITCIYIPQENIAGNNETKGWNVRISLKRNCVNIR